MFNKMKKRLSQGVGAFVAALALATLTSPPAYAQSGESDTWSIEAVVGAPGNQVRSQIGMDQTRDSSGNVVDAWVDDRNHVVVSYNNGPAATWTNSATGWRPAVISTPWGFRVFHTGVDSHVYYAGVEVNSDGSLRLGQWVQVPNNVRTTHEPSVTALPGANQEQWMLSWRGLDGYVYTQWHQRTSSMQGIGFFDTPVQVPGARTPGAPDIAYTHVTNNNVYISGGIFVDWTGDNGQLYIASQDYGNSNWQYRGTVAPSVPGARATISFAGNSEHGIVAQTYTDADSQTTKTRTATVRMTPTSTGIGYWQTESTGRWNFGTPVLSPWGNSIYLLSEDLDGDWWWKRLYQR